MTDMPIDIAALVDDEDELVFGEVAAPAPANDEKPLKAKKPKRAPKKGSEAAADIGEAATTVSAAPEPAAAAEPADQHPAPVPRQGTGSAGSSVSEIAPAAAPAEAPAPAPAPAPAKDRRGLLLGTALGLSVVTSFASLGGLIAVGRSLATLDAARAHAAEQDKALAQIGPLVARLAEVAPRAAATATSLPSGAAATPDDLHHAVDDLKLALAQAQGRDGGGGPVVATMQGGFVELNEHLNRIERELDEQRPHVVVTPVRGGH